MPALASADLAMSQPVLSKAVVPIGSNCTEHVVWSAITTTGAANPALAEAQARAPVVVFAHAETCSFQFDPIGRAAFDRTGCDIAKSALARAGIPYANEDGTYDGRAIVRVGDVTLPVTDKATFDAALTDAL